jgi:2-iminobutanoate/2-iminopropanoate deaminase
LPIIGRRYLPKEKIMEKKIIATPNAPGAVGPYSQGARVGHLVYTAGQVALDPATGQLVGDDVAAQTEQVIKNLSAVLEVGGSSLANVVKTTVFLTTMADFAAMNEVYGRHFAQNPPARTTVAVAGLPLNALVEIEAVGLAE